MALISWKRMKRKAILLCFVVTTMAFLLACSGEVNGVPEPRNSSDRDIEAGRQLIASYGCGACHTIPGIPGADGMAAPPLNKFYERSYISGEVPNTWDNLIQYIQHPQDIEPGTVMPDLGVKAEEAREIAAYLYHQPTLIDWIRR
jgi:cytochrome c2